MRGGTREGEREEITLKESNRVGDTIKERETERVGVMKATKTRRLKRKEDRDRRCDPWGQDTASFLSSICTSAPPDSPLRFASAIEEKCSSEILPLHLGFQAITRLPRDLITFLNEAGLSSLIKMIGPYYMLSQLKGQKSLVALEFCQISFCVSFFFPPPLSAFKASK